MSKFPDVTAPYETAPDLQRIYNVYERRANYSLSRIRSSRSLLISSIIAIIITFILYMFTFVDALIILIVGVVIFVAGYLVINTLFRLDGSEIKQIERDEGYSPRFLQLMNQKIITHQYPMYNIEKGIFNNINGYYDLTITQYKNIVPYTILNNPLALTTYYPVCLEALCMTGDMAMAKQIYEQGLYFMLTYMHSPVNGYTICRAIAIYEYTIGNYQASLECCDNALRVLSEDKNEKDASIHQRLSAHIKYIVALNYAEMGRKQEALQILNKIRMGLVIPYTLELVNKLQNELMK